MEPNKIINWVENKKIENAKIENQWKIIRPPVKYTAIFTVVLILLSVSLFICAFNRMPINGPLILYPVACIYFVFLFGGFSGKITLKTRFQIWAVVMLGEIGIFFMRPKIVIYPLVFVINEAGLAGTDIQRVLEILVVIGFFCFLGSCYLFRKIKLEFV